MADVVLYPDAVRRLVDPYIARLADHVAQRARDLAPSRTGHLRRSIHAHPLALPQGAWAVTASTEYAIYVERGAEPFLLPSLREVVGP